MCRPGDDPDTVAHTSGRAAAGFEVRVAGRGGRALAPGEPGRDPSEAGVLAFCRARLANYKVPRVVEFRADLPRNPAGKPLKRLLRQEPR
jgi:HIP---CoA ligase